MMPKTLNLDALVDPFGAGNHRENKLALQAKSPNKSSVRLFHFDKWD